MSSTTTIPAERPYELVTNGTHIAIDATPVKIPLL